ncbi:MAG TPA: helix-turn-helix domain-containing protein [Candidatus Methylacidiphilales bacterium]|nr:helix-turn-helix domain-containing protein [Candidatus Methylacidiphilales bacterium]
MPPSPALSQLRQIERLTSSIPSPASYLQGRATGVASLPANILCFARHSADELMAHRSARTHHQHHRFVLIVALRGAGRVCVDIDTFSLRPGQAQLLFPFQFHSYLDVAPERICWLFITFEMDAEHDVAPLRSSGSGEIARGDLPLLGEFVRGWLARAPMRLLQLHLATLLVRQALNRRTAPAARKPAKEMPEAGILSLVNRYVLPRLERPITVKAMAGALGHSESHLRRRFRLATGLSLGRHLRELRLRRACSLLRGTSLPVGEVAARCGFDSIYAFSRAFRTEVRVSPRGYRKSMTHP